MQYIHDKFLALECVDIGVMGVSELVHVCARKLIWQVRHRATIIMLVVQETCVLFAAGMDLTLVRQQTTLVMPQLKVA